MAKRTRRDKLAEQLTLDQQKAAYMLLDNELRSEADPEHLTQDEIAKACGVHRATLFRWRTENKTFIEFRKEVAKDYLGDAVGIFVNSLIKSMKGTNGAPSMKALDLYAKHIGFIQPDNKVDVNIGGAKSDEDIADELARLDEQLADMEEIDEEGE